MALNLHLLRLFAVVAKHGSFSRAAEALHISQPAVSKGVRDFEAQVGGPLLERGAGNIRPTAVGEALLRHATTLFAAERAAEDELAEMRGLTRGHLTVGASMSVGTYILPPLLGVFQRKHPGVQLRLRIANTHGVVEQVLARELDVALVEGPVDQPGIVVTPWRTDRMIVIAAPGHPLTRRRPTIALLSEQMLIIREPGSGTREVVDSALASQGVTPRATMEVGSTEAVMQVVMAGLGVGIVSAVAAEPHLKLGTLKVCELRGFCVQRTLTQLSLPGRQMSSAARAFETVLAEASEIKLARRRQ